MEKSEKDKLIQEMNELSDYTGISEEEKESRKARMVEIAKILLSEHYGFNPKNRKEWKRS